jgi:hypothetical protein
MPVGPRNFRPVRAVPVVRPDGVHWKREAIVAYAEGEVTALAGFAATVRT